MIIPQLLQGLGAVFTMLSALPVVGGVFGGVGAGFTGLSAGITTALTGISGALGGGTFATALFGGPAAGGASLGTTLPAWATVAAPTAAGPITAGGPLAGTLFPAVSVTPAAITAAGGQVTAGAIAPAAGGTLGVAEGVKGLSAMASLAAGVMSFTQTPPALPRPYMKDPRAARRRRHAMFEERKQRSRNIFSGSVFGDDPTVIRPALLGPGAPV